MGRLQMKQCGGLLEHKVNASLHSFLLYSSTSAQYSCHIRHLNICTAELVCHADQAKAIVTLLTCYSHLEKLILRMAGSMKDTI